MTFADIDAVVIGKAPDALEGVMMPELSLCRRARCGRQADPSRAHRRVGRRVDRDHRGRRSSSRVATTACSSCATRSSPRATPRGRCRAGAPAVRARAARSRRGSAATSSAPGAPEHIGWKVAVKDRLNALKNPYAHLHLPGHHDREGQGVADAVGPAALPRVVPVVGRRGGDRARQRGRRPRARRSRRRGSSPTPSAPSSASFPGRDTVRIQAGRRLRRRAVQARRASRTRSSRSTAPSSTCRSRWYEPMWLEGHLITPEGEGWKLTDVGRDRARRPVPGQHVAAACCRRTRSARRG